MTATISETTPAVGDSPAPGQVPQATVAQTKPGRKHGWWPWERRPRKSEAVMVRLAEDVPVPAEPKQPRHWHLPLLAPFVISNAAVTSMASLGQYGFARTQLHFNPVLSAALAVTVESIAINVGANAHHAMMNNDSAFRAKFMSYAIGIGVGVLNYSHYTRHFMHPETAGVVMGLLSASSPVLWGQYSRRASRDALKRLGVIEGRAVRFGPTRWLWHPVRTAQTMFFATWAGITDPVRAIREWEAARRERRANGSGSSDRKVRPQTETERRDATGNGRGNGHGNPVRTEAETTKAPEAEAATEVQRDAETTETTDDPETGNGSQAQPEAGTGSQGGIFAIGNDLRVAVNAIAEEFLDASTEEFVRATAEMVPEILAKPHGTGTHLARLMEEHRGSAVTSRRINQIIDQINRERSDAA